LTNAKKCVIIQIELNIPFFYIRNLYMAGMPHDLNSTPSYEHMMGKEHKAHEGSQSKSPGGAPEKSPGGATNKASKKGKSLPEKAPGGMSYADE
jgi:hypothetical protein